MERNCHLIDLHKVIMAVILTAIKNQKNLHTLLDKPAGIRALPISYSVILPINTNLALSNS